MYLSTKLKFCGDWSIFMKVQTKQDVKTGKQTSLIFLDRNETGPFVEIYLSETKV